MIKFKTRVLILEISIIILTAALFTSLYINYKSQQSIVVVNLNQVIGELANDIATNTKDKAEQQAKTQQMVQRLEQHLVELPKKLTVFNAASIIKPGKFKDYSEQLLMDVRGNANK